MSDQTTKDIQETCDEIAALLKAKNEAYGDAALSPLRIFSRADAEVGLRIRIDDKLSRMMSDSVTFVEEDTVLDLMGYLVLLRIAQKRRASRSRIS